MKILEGVTRFIADRPPNEERIPASTMYSSPTEELLATKRRTPQLLLNSSPSAEGLLAIKRRTPHHLLNLKDELLAFY